MKLIDILARDLPQWPEGVTLIGQDKNRHLSYLMLEQRDGYWPDRIEVFSDGRVELADDQSTALVRRQEWGDRIAINELLNDVAIEHGVPVHMLKGQVDRPLTDTEKADINVFNSVLKGDDDVLGVAVAKVEGNDDE